jgi:cyclophilin family peptidyl-prolyl cis-trans isomerase
MLDGKYSIFGQVTSGIDVANQVKAGDRINSVEILDSPKALFADQSKRIGQWNKVLDKGFSDRLAPPFVAP